MTSTEKSKIASIESSEDASFLTALKKLLLVAGINFLVDLPERFSRKAHKLRILKQLSLKFQ